MDFIVTLDVLMNDTSWFSDVVLPEASYLERYDPLSMVGSARRLASPSCDSRSLSHKGRPNRPCGSTKSWEPVWA